jgi:outer membrane protein OmpA-like peptidoglycan-associated protein
MLRVWETLISLVIILCWLSPAFSADRFSIINIHPNADVGRYFFVQGSETLPQLKLNVGTFSIYDNRPLRLDTQTVIVRRSGTTVTRERQGIDNLVYQYFYGALGLTNGISLMVDAPVFLHYDYSQVSGGQTVSGKYHFKPGDVWISGKIRALDVNKHNVGLAFIPSVSIPTGKEEHFLGDVGVTGEARAILEAKPADRLLLAFNAAYQTRKDKVELANISFRDRLIFALGANYQVSDNASLIGEIETQTAVKHFFNKKETTPTEARLGVRWHPGGGYWALGIGGSAGIIYGAGASRYSGFLTASLSSQRFSPKPEVAKAEEVPEKEMDQCFSVSSEGDHYHIVCIVHFGFDKAQTGDTDVVMNVANYIKSEEGTVDVEVRGWTDKVGTTEYNKELALERARSVAELVKKDLGDDKNKAKIQVLGIGKDTVSERSAARRVEIIVK